MEGRRLPDNWNRHHVFHSKRWYRHGFERTNFRNHKGLLVPMPIELHKDLHANVPPPPKPLRWMMHQCIEVLDATAPTEHAWGVLAAQEYFYDLADSYRTGEADIAHRIANNLSQQLGYITLKVAA